MRLDRELHGSLFADLAFGLLLWIEKAHRHPLLVVVVSNDSDMDKLSWCVSHSFVSTVFNLIPVLFSCITSITIMMLEVLRD